MPYVDSDGVRIHYQVEGRGPPLVLVHGFTCSLEDWRDNGMVAALRDDYQLILIDARGHGGSDRPHDPELYAMEQRARDVVAVLDALGVQRTNYLGYSMGGRIGLDLAHVALDRLNSLIVGGSSHHPVTAEEAARGAANLAKGNAAFVAGQTLPDHPARGRLEARLLANDSAALAAACVPRPDRTNTLPTIKVPCLVYAGDADPGAYPRAQELAARLPNATFVALPGQHHWAGLYATDLILPHVRRFLAGVAQSRVELGLP